MSEKTKKLNWFKGLKTEFDKIIWPDRGSVAKQTAVVVTIGIFLGVLISIFDMVINYGIMLLTQ